MDKYVWGGITILLTLFLLGGTAFTITILDDRTIVELPSDQCEKGLSLIIHDDYMKVKCGWNIVFESKEYVDYWRTYGVNEDTGEDAWWVQDSRKASLVDVYVIDESPDHFIVRKEVPYYKGRSGTDGLLIIDYVFTKDKIKWNYNFTTENNAKHRIKLNIVKDRTDEYGYDFIPDDNLYVGLVNGEHYYGDVKGNLFIDPIITITSTAFIIDGSYNETFDNRTYINNASTNATIVDGYTTTKLANFGYDDFADSSINFSKWSNESFGPNSYTINLQEGSGRMYMTHACSGDNLCNDDGGFFSSYNLTGDNFDSWELSYNWTSQLYLNGVDGGRPPDCDYYLQITNSTSTTTIYTKHRGSAGTDTNIITLEFFFLNKTVNVYEDGVLDGSSPVDISGIGNNWYLRVYGDIYHYGTDSTSCTWGIEYLNRTTPYTGNETVQVVGSVLNLTDYITNFTGVFDETTSGNSTYEYSFDNTTWTEFVNGGNNWPNTTSTSFYWRTLFNNSNIINSVNFTFDKYIWVDAVNITPVNPYINDTLYCNYSFYNDTGGSPIDYSNISWYVNDIYVVSYQVNESSTTLDNTYFEQNNNITCEVLPYDLISYGDKVNSSNYVYINWTSGVNLTVEGYNTSQKYEQSTSPNISCTAYDIVDGSELPFQEVCLSIGLTGYGTNYTCDNGIVNVTWTIPFVSSDLFNDSSTSQNATNNGSVVFDLEDYYDVLNLTFDLWSWNSTLDSTLIILNSSSADVNLRGNFSENWLDEYRFSDNNVSKEFFLLTSTSTSHDVKLSTAGNFTNNITLTINASESNPVELSYIELWLNDNYFNDTGSYDGTLPLVLHDPINVEVGGKWNYDTSGGGSAEFDGTEGWVEASGSSSCTCGWPENPECTDVDSSWLNNVADIDFSGNNRIDVTVDFSLSASGFGAGSGASYMYYYLTTDTAGSTNYVTIIDGEAIESGGSTYCANSPCSGSGTTISFRRNTDDNWNVYYEDVFQKTITPPTDSTTYLKAAGYSQASGVCVDWSGSRTGVGGGSYSVAISEISYGGFGKNWSGTNFTAGNYTAVSDILINSSPDDTVSIYPVYYTSEADASCSATFFVSADNGTTWEDVASETYHTFDTPGSYVKYKMEVNDTSNTTGVNCLVYGVELTVESSYPNNTVLYFGTSTENASYNFTGEINDTNTPVSISFTPNNLNEYIDTYCDDVTCDVPLLFVTDSDTGGVLTIYNMSFNQSLDNVFLSDTVVDSYLSTCSGTCPVNITVNRTNEGIIEFSDLDVLYYGSGNITVDCDSDGANDDYDMQVRHSPYSINFVPPHINSWDMYPTSVNSKNVQPFGQTGVYPIYTANFTAGEDDVDLYMKLNESIDSCFSVWTTNTTSYSSDAVVLETDVDNLICDNVANDGYCNIWMWANLTACTSVGLPTFNWNSACSDCVITADMLDGD